MDHVTLKYTEALVREAAFTFWKRTVGVGFLVAVAIVGAALGFALFRGERSWLVGALAASLAGALAICTLVYRVHLRRGLSKFAELDSQSATLDFDAETISMASNLGKTTLRWSAIKEVWQSPTFWLLLFSSSQFVTLPLTDMTSEQQRRFIEYAKNGGAKVS